jgi:membrane-bound lytic murein transglycosylase B
MTLYRTILPHSFVRFWLALCLGAVWTSAPASMLEREGARAFIREIAAQEGFNAAELRGLFEQIEPRPAVIEAMRSPAEALPWRRYRPIFMTEERAAAGRAFLRQHADVLARAQREYGVPPAIVTAIIGVETFYGRHQGEYPVLDTLATLAFDYPPRNAFFRGELEQFLQLARSEGLAPRAVKGSYAGAMGMPQFIASSYRAYAVDFDGDGRRDLWDSPADVIGSVAAYLGRHGWQAGAPIAHRLQPPGEGYRELLQEGLEPRVTAAQLRAAGLRLEPTPTDGERVHVFELEGKDGTQVWAGRRNFYVITRYNHSALYAMAVYQLAERIRRAGAEAGA